MAIFFGLHGQSRRGSTVITARKNHKSQASVVGHIYALQNLVERWFNKLKNASRQVKRYVKTTDIYLGFVELAAAKFWIRHSSK